MAVSAKSLVLDLLSTLKGRTVPVRLLVAAADLFDIRGDSVRVALTRLCASGLLERDERGQYRFARGARPMQTRATGWAEIERQMVPWSGDWLGAHTVGLPRTPRSRTERSRRALELSGFREFASGLWLRPDNLRGGVERARRSLVALGLSPCPTFRLSDLPGIEKAAPTLFDVPALLESYRILGDELARSARRLARLPRERAMVESFVLGGRGIRQLVYDPLLPEPLVPFEARRALIAEMKRYDELGRRVWRPFMREYGAASGEAPMAFQYRERSTQMGAEE